MFDLVTNDPCQFLFLHQRLAQDVKKVRIPRINSFFASFDRFNKKYSPILVEVFGAPYFPLVFVDLLPFLAFLFAGDGVSAGVFCCTGALLVLGRFFVALFVIAAGEAPSSGACTGVALVGLGSREDPA